jgi:[2Fe-2S] binding domain
MGLCGACFVLIGGRARASCDLPVSAVDGPVITVEELAAGGRLHPVQQAFIDEQAAQCGYCTSRGGWRVVRCAGGMRYPDDGGLTATERAQREPSEVSPSG